MKLSYYRNGDYLLPDLAVNETDQQSLGKYGMLRLHFLETHRPVHRIWDGLMTSMFCGSVVQRRLSQPLSTETTAVPAMRPIRSTWRRMSSAVISMRQNRT